jgi:hypothetical protein
VHGRIDASHVLVGDHGRPILCGLGDGRTAAEPSDDVAAIGRLIVDLLGRDEESEPIPERRWRRPGRWSGWERRSLLLVADQASAEPPSRRPTARRLAAAISDAMPVAATSRPEDLPPTNAESDDIGRLRPSAHRDDAPSLPRRLRIGATAVGGVVFMVIAVGRLTEASQDLPETSDPTTAFSVSEVAAPVEGGILVSKGRRYQVGEEGDHLLLGDWQCEGVLTPAVFRPSSHEVFVFDRWTVDSPLSIRPVAVVAASVALVSGREGDGCPVLGVRTADGDVVPVPAGGNR